MEEVHWLLNSMIPFGSPVQMETRAIKSMHYVTTNSSSSSSTIRKSSYGQQQQKKPSWKPFPGAKNENPVLSISVREELRVVQYADIEDYLDVSGTITCRVDVPGVPTLMIPLTNSSRAEYVG